MEKKLLIGFDRQIITPKESVPLAGYGNTSSRFSTVKLDDIYATCIAATAGEDTILFFTVDMVLPATDWVVDARKAVSAATGVAPERIMVSYTHTHSAPDPWSTEPVIKTYRAYWLEQLTKAAAAAMEDRTPATVSGGNVVVPGMNFGRHYVNAKGQKGGWTSIEKPFTGHAEINDPQMVLARFTREGKQDILLMNWQAHPCFTSTPMARTELSSDYIGQIRDAVEKTGLLFAFFLGASGNMNATTFIESEKHGLNNETYGQKLAQIALEQLDQLQPLGDEGVYFEQQVLEYPYNHIHEDKVIYADEIMDVWAKEGYYPADEVAKKYGLSSPHHARALLTNVTRPASGTMELDVMRLGGLAVALAPYEMFASSGIHIKNGSPFDVTMVFSCSNQYQAYIPTIEAFDFECYESHTAVFSRGVAEDAAEQFVQMLKRL